MKATAILRHRNKKKSNTAVLKRFAMRWMREELLNRTPGDVMVLKMNDTAVTGNQAGEAWSKLSKALKNG